MKIDKMKHRYDNFCLDILDIKLEKGTIIGLVGDNGAGKTTFMNILSGFLKANDTFKVADYKMDNILYIPSDLSVYDYLTVAEFIDLVILMSHSQASLDNVIHKLGLQDKEKTPISDLSQGMKKKLTLVTLFTEHNDLVILDEPFNSIDMNFVHDLKLYLKELSKEQTILISSHILDTLSDLCDSFIYLKNGQVYKQFKNDSSNTLEREIFE